MARKPRRGMSFGTLLTLALVLAVAAGYAVLLPQLQGSHSVRVDAGAMLSALKIDQLPDLATGDIPILDLPQQVVHATAAPTLVPEQPSSNQQQKLSLTVGGSLVLDASVRRSVYYQASKAWDFTELTGAMVNAMQGDVTLLAMDNILTDAVKAAYPTVGTAAVAMLQQLGVDGASLGFARAYEQGLDGVSSGVRALQAAGIAALGVTDRQDNPANPVLLSTPAGQIAVLRYTVKASDGSQKRLKKDGNAWALPIAETEAMRADIAVARSRGAMLVLVMLDQSGATKKAAPTKSQISMAQTAADAGADVVIGTGSLSVQPVQMLTGADGRQVLCAYSLGRLLSDDRSDAGVGSMLLHIEATVDNGSARLTAVTYTPTYIWREKQDGQTRYRVLPANQPAPDGMKQDQQKAMTDALKRVQGILSGGPAVMRVP